MPSPEHTHGRNSRAAARSRPREIPLLSGERREFEVPIDPNGNLTSKTEGSDTWTYEWNARNELTRVLKNGVEQTRFAYDALGRRVEKVAAGVATGYTYDRSNILREVPGSTTLKYVYGPAIDEPLGVDTGTALSYYHADGLGSIVRTSDSVGAVTLTRQYDAWGNLEAGGSVSGHAFTGREWDPETGLYYYRARHYDAKTGSFISDDPAKLRGGLNFRAYVKANPVRFRDPKGLWAAGYGAGVNGGLAAGPAGIAGEADCKFVTDGQGNVGLLCCAGAGPAVGFAEEAGVAVTGIFCFSCRTICDLEGVYVTAQGGGGAGAGAAGSAGASAGSEQIAVVGSVGPAEAAGGYVGVVIGGCKLYTSTISCSPCKK